MDGDDLEAVEQIVAEQFLLDQLLKGSVGRREQSNVDFVRFVVSNPCDLLFFEHSKQLDLGAHGHISDFVEKQCPTVGVLKSTFTIRDRIGKRAADVTEKLAFHKRFGDCAHVQGYQSLGFPGAVLVDRSSDHLFACTALAGDQYGRIGRSDPLEPIDQVLHLRTGKDDPFESEFLVEPTPQIEVRLT